jgi:hypothetical protein
MFNGGMQQKLRILLLGTFITLLSCASKVLQYDKMEALTTNEEYSEKIKVKELAQPSPTPSGTASPSPTSSDKSGGNLKAAVATAPTSDQKVVSHKKKKKSKLEHRPQIEMVVKDGPRQPDLEDAEGFDGRRPIKDPFRPGENVDLAITYLRMTAGHLNVKVLPFVEVNGAKAYHLQVTAKSNDFFSHFYGVDDVADTYLNFESMLPYNLETRVRESKQLKDIRSFIDHDKLKADYWEKKVTKQHGEENKKLQWDILPYTQNVISAAYYMRIFTYTPGKTLQFRVTDEGKNIVAKIHILRKEKLSTPFGTLDTVVARPEFQVDGIFKPVGEILFWVTDDDRKFIVRIESAIKIGTIVAKVTKIDPGTP